MLRSVAEVFSWITVFGDKLDCRISWPLTASAASDESCDYALKRRARFACSVVCYRSLNPLFLSLVCVWFPFSSSATSLAVFKSDLVRLNLLHQGQHPVSGQQWILQAEGQEQGSCLIYLTPSIPPVLAVCSSGTSDQAGLLIKMAREVVLVAGVCFCGR